MTEIEQAYRTLDLKPGATVKEIVEARDDLLALWDPNRLKSHPRLRSKAAVKIREIHGAYQVLMQHPGQGEGAPAREASGSDRRPLLLWRPNPFRPRTRPSRVSAAPRPSSTRSFGTARPRSGAVCPWDPFWPERWWFSRRS